MLKIGETKLMPVFGVNETTIEVREVSGRAHCYVTESYVHGIKAEMAEIASAGRQAGKERDEAREALRATEHRLACAVQHDEATERSVLALGRDVGHLTRRAEKAERERNEAWAAIARLREEGRAADKNCSALEREVSALREIAPEMSAALARFVAAAKGAEEPAVEVPRRNTEPVPATNEERWGVWVFRDGKYDAGAFFGKEALPAQSYSGAEACKEAERLSELPEWSGWCFVARRLLR